MIIIKYTTEQEKETIISQKEAEGLILVEVANITEGNFLGFVESLDEVPKPKTPTEQKILDLQNQIDQLTITLGDALLEGGI